MVRGRYAFDFDLMPFVCRDMPLRKRLNLLRAGLNLLYRRGSPWSWPVHMQLELTSFCDLTCPVCPTGTGELRRRPEAMDPELVEALMEEVGPYLLTASLWGWGEPLLHPRLGDILATVRGKNVLPILSTNGQRLAEEDVLDALIREPPANLIVALDGLSDETLSAYRPGARLEPALTGVRRLAEMKKERSQQWPVLHMRFIALKQNEHEVPRVEEFAARHGFEMVSIRGLSVIDADEGPHRAMVPGSDELRSYRYEEGGRVGRDGFICQFASLFPAVFADGTVVACDQDYNASHAYGRLGKDGSFADIWFGRRAAEVRGTVRDSPERFSFCANCPYAGLPRNTCSIRLTKL
jgi:MoaA/NifB/PqqE/SkfB family radical SAM enzyme